MISPSKGRYDILLLQPVGLSLHMTTYIQKTGESPRTTKAQTIRAKYYVNREDKSYNRAKRCLFNKYKDLILFPHRSDEYRSLINLGKEKPRAILYKINLKHKHF